MEAVAKGRLPVYWAMQEMCLMRTSKESLVRPRKGPKIKGQSQGTSRMTAVAFIDCELSLRWGCEQQPPRVLPICLVSF